MQCKASASGMEEVRHCPGAIVSLCRCITAYPSKLGAGEGKREIKKERRKEAREGGREEGRA